MPALNPLIRFSSGFCIVLLGAAICGCASSKEEGLPTAARTAGSRPPLFLTGAVSVLLTNAGQSYSAWVEMDPSSSGAARDFTSGQLLCRGSKLLFIPAHGSKKKRAKAGGVTFIWDVAEKQGTVLSEALQGFAPFSAHTSPTNVVLSAQKSSQQKIEGHPCKSEECVVQMNDGSATLFQVWRAMDLKAIPVQISTATNVPPSTIVLSKLRLESLSEGLFAPPEGFTKYSSAEAMMDELAVRQGSLRRKSSEEFIPPSPEQSPYRRGP